MFDILIQHNELIDDIVLMFPRPIIVISLPDIFIMNKTIK